MGVRHKSGLFRKEVSSKISEWLYTDYLNYNQIRRQITHTYHSTLNMLIINIVRLNLPVLQPLTA